MPPYYLYIPSVGALCCIISGTLCRKHIPLSLNLLVAEALLSLSVDVICYIWFHSTGSTNDAIHNVYCATDFFLLLCSSYSLLPAKVRNRAYVVLGSLFLGCWGFYVIRYGIYRLSNLTIVFSFILLIINDLMMLYFNETKPLYKAVPQIRVVCLSMILYHCGTAPLFVMIQFFLVKLDVQSHMLDINTALDAIKYILLSAAFWRFRYPIIRNEPALNG